MVQVFRVFVPTSALALLFTEAIIIFASFTAASFFVVPVDPEVFLLYDNGFKRIALVVATLLFGLYFQNLYTHFRVRSRILLVQQLLLVIGVVFLFQALISYAGSQWMMPRSLMLTGCGFVLIVLPIWRTLYSRVLYRALGAQKLLFFGANADSVELARRIAHHPELGLSAIGFLDASHVGEYLSGAPVLAPPTHLQSVIAEGKPDRLVVGLT
ncbi:MAG: hypothetical protein H7X89_01420, partial [Rhizobiales bacterium]|nr:hypothetical protein [Hyphomicrobiales bacterium]